MTKKEKDFLKFGIVSKIFYPESSNFVPILDDLHGVMNRPDIPVRICSDDHYCSFILPHILHLYIRYKNCLKIVDFRLYFEKVKFSNFEKNCMPT